MAKMKIDDDIQVVWVKTIIYGLIIILLITMVSLAPKQVFSDDLGYKLATSMSITQDDNLLLYDYQVYGTEERFNEGLIEDINDVKADFKERNEVLAIKIYGEKETIVFHDDYLYMTDPDTPELNIEYYLVKDMEFNEMNVPSRTFIMLFDDIARLVNNVYLGVLMIVFLSIFIPFVIKETRYIVYLLKIHKNI
jgi:hypothetical protein